jgi:hypothetical protein
MVGVERVFRDPAAGKQQQTDPGKRGQAEGVDAIFLSIGFVLRQGKLVWGER